MTNARIICIGTAAVLGYVGCGGGSSSGTRDAGTITGAAGAAGTGGTAGTTGAAGATGTGGAAGPPGTGGAAGTGGAVGTLSADQVMARAAAYKAAHPGNGGKDWDIIACCGSGAPSPAALAADPAAQELRSICGKDQLPVIPTIAWEYGGSDHAWIDPGAAAVAYCVYLPVKPSTPHWSYDVAADHVTADVYVKFPDQNPCKGQTGADQVLKCLGDPTNVDILIDTASYHDGADVGYDVSNASTDLMLVMPDGTRIPLFHGL
jgi:hypothetical protein